MEIPLVHLLSGAINRHPEKKALVGVVWNPLIILFDVNICDGFLFSWESICAKPK